MKRFLSIAGLILVCATWSLRAADVPASQPSSQADWFAMSLDEFARAEAPNQRLRFDRIDRPLLSAAILHETNRRRAENHLPLFQHHPKLDEAAEIHVKDMSEKRYLQHEEKDNPKHREPIDRARAVGLNPMLIAENIATAFGIQYQAGRKVYPLEQWNRTGLSYEPNGKPIPPHTYVSFARALVSQWMDSPHHRENILLPDARYMGSACTPSRDPSDDREFHKFYCAQEFFTPMPEGRRPAQRGN
jgi:uncharacterized protein YkwD